MRPALLPLVLLAFLLTGGCTDSHNIDPLLDGGGPADSGGACPDLSCDDRCVAVSVCNCLAPGGDFRCAVRGGRCVDDLCVPADAGIADTGPTLDTRSDGGRPAPTGGVPCGRAGNCEAGVAYCNACWNDDPMAASDAHCEPSGDDGRFPFRDGFAGHVCDVTPVFVECDGSEDCGLGEVCIFFGGELGYGQCWTADDPSPPGAVACHGDSDCADGVRCGEVDPLGYFSPLYEQLGWRPYACGGASALASEFCDRIEAACGVGDGRGFSAREQCLGYLDRLTHGERACAFSHLAQTEGDFGHCRHVAEPPSPCAP